MEIHAVWQRVIAKRITEGFRDTLSRLRIALSGGDGNAHQKFLHGRRLRFTSIGTTSPQPRVGDG